MFAGDKLNVHLSLLFYIIHFVPTWLIYTPYPIYQRAGW